MEKQDAENILKLLSEKVCFEISKEESIDIADDIGRIIDLISLLPEAPEIEFQNQKMILMDDEPCRETNKQEIVMNAPSAKEGMFLINEK